MTDPLPHVPMAETMVELARQQRMAQVRERLAELGIDIHDLIEYLAPLINAEKEIDI